MAQGFSVTRKGLEAKFERGEIVLLRELINDLKERLGDEAPADQDPLVAITGISTEPVERPSDPIMARLFPDAHISDSTIAGEFRRLADLDQRAGRRAAYTTVLDDLSDSADGHIRLDKDGAEVWLRVINDLRLGTGTVADVTEEWDHDVDSLDEDDPRAAFLHLYDWLTWLQSRLLAALTG